MLLDDSSEAEPDIHYLAIAADTEWVNVAGEWNARGMRGTVSRDLIMRDCFVPEEAQLLRRRVSAGYPALAAYVSDFSTDLFGDYPGRL